MKRLSTLVLLSTALFSLSLGSCGGGGSSSGGDTPNPTPEESEQLKEFKKQAIDDLTNYLDKSNYREAETTQIDEIVSEYTTKINAAKSILDVDKLYNEAIEKLDALKTDEDYKKEEIPTYENSTSTEASRKYDKLGYKPLYKDYNFREPILCTKTHQREKPYYHYDDLLDPHNTGKSEFQWQIAQWNSKFDLIDYDGGENNGHTITTSGDYNLIKTITGKGKEIEGEVVPSKIVRFDTATGELQLILSGRAEYDHARTSDEGWAHLLMQQNYDKDELYKLSDKESIMMESEFTINSCVNYMGSEYNSGIHCAQVVWYIKLKNYNEESPGYGQSIWFGLGVFDSRTAGQTTREYVAHDAGTGTLIVSPGSDVTYADYKGLTPKPGETRKISVDVVEVLKSAFITARGKGYLSNTNWDDLYIDHTNFGYEVTGTFDIDVTYKNIGVYAK